MQPQQNNPQASGSGSGPFRLSLQLPEKKRQQLQAHERKRMTTGPDSNNGSSSGGSSGQEGNQGPVTGSVGGQNNANFYNPASMTGGLGTSYIPHAMDNYQGTSSTNQYPYNLGVNVPSSTASDQQAAQQARNNSINQAMNMHMMPTQIGQSGNPAMGRGMGGMTTGYGNPMNMGQQGGTSPAESIGSYNDQVAGLAGPSASGGPGPSSLVPGAADPETFEFMKRKRWPQLLMQELVGAAVWCLVPYDPSPQTGPGKGQSGWKIMFASPATHELLGFKPEEIEEKDWADLIYPMDLARLMQNIRSSIASQSEISLGSPPLQHHYQLSSSRTSAYDPPNIPHNVPMGGFAGPNKTLNAYTRMLNKDGKETLFELRGHPFFGGDDDEPRSPDSTGSNGGFDGGGVMGTTRAQRKTFQSGMNEGRNLADDDERSCKAFWIMGRKWQGQGDGGAKMLDSFLELKMENERLRQELRDLQARPYVPRAHINPVASSSYIGPQGSTMGPSVPINKTAPPQSSYMGNMESSDEDDGYEDDDRPNPAVRQASPGGNFLHIQQFQYHDQAGPSMSAMSDEKKAKKQKIKNPEYLCRNCGRNDSPEWRKGPLGPKTLCNACGLRWAKRNAGNIPRRKPKDKDKEDDKGGLTQHMDMEPYEQGFMDMN